MGTLAIPHRFDLPPRWDGQRVTWDDWKDQADGFNSLDVHMPREACERCSSKRRGPIIVGLVDGVVRLHVERCFRCGLDNVFDFETDTAWTLDDRDYGFAGSVEDEW